MLDRFPPPSPPPFSLQKEEETNTFERGFLAIGNEKFAGSYKLERWKLASTGIIYPFSTFRLVLFSSKDMTQAKGNCRISHFENLSPSWKPAKILSHNKLRLFKIFQCFLQSVEQRFKEIQTKIRQETLGIVPKGLQNAKCNLPSRLKKSKFSKKKIDSQHWFWDKVHLRVCNKFPKLSYSVIIMPSHSFNSY